MTIYSFDGVIRQGRTMHSFELPFSKKRVALPRPVPFVSFAYLAAFVLAAILVARVIPVVAGLDASFSALSGGDAGMAAAVTYYVLVPSGVVWLAMNFEVDGRAPHLWVLSFARFLVRDKRVLCGRRARASGERVRYGGNTRFWWDLDAPRLHHGYVRGGSVTTSVAVRFTHAVRHRHLVMRPHAGGDVADAYDVASSLEVRP